MKGSLIELQGGTTRGETAKDLGLLEVGHTMAARSG